ncbi:hypothetical protein CCR94_20625 [Rhodoblastus sphagnicola]|uniref:Threonine/Serine exporter ThrE domain-containing protein n=1 Tax=Rhodoblastus sphagnicola TaxID=333368 RepID=A0A2S6MY00_9HYPH|nr:threonine/serine exporter family protein [Rhodoblastus sphagnicola]MBB4198097.1 uncharacterized membrane protein YjjB (DUF3815 family) [Rhodoblastus sphagnicola]PPQ27237.1 hypothetical protein CCR94_20625 [Rhodoblastus sphagnicola]
MIDLAAQARIVLHQAFFGGLAAAGFGVLFNFGPRSLALCAGAGAFALAVRTLGLDANWTLEAATFVAALATASVAMIGLRGIGAAAQAIALAGCIPMVPGAFLNEALLGFFTISASEAVNAEAAILPSLQAMLRFIFTLGAIGAGLAIPSHLARHRGF